MDIKQMLCPNFGYKNSVGYGQRGTPGRHGHKIEAIVLHVSGGTWASNRDWLMRQVSVSYNYYVRKTGEIICFVLDSNPAWANGVINNPTWRHLKQGINPNLYTLSISREGHNHEIPTPQQYASILWLVKEKAKEHKVPLDRSFLIGHSEIDSVNRWYCPGSGLNWFALMQDLKAVPARQEYIVAKGDTFWGIARRFGLSVPELAGANPGITEPSKIYPGQKILLPEKKYA